MYFKVKKFYLFIYLFIKPLTVVVAIQNEVILFNKHQK